MKTKEEMRNEVVNYLENVSKHIFMTKDGKYQTVVKKGNEHYAYKDGNLVKINPSTYIESYGSNAKNVISHVLFPQHEYDSTWGYSKDSKLRSVRYTKYLRILVNEGKQAANAFKARQADIDKAKQQEIVGN